jgi:hypothetical protein
MKVLSDLISDFFNNIDPQHRSKLARAFIRSPRRQARVAWADLESGRTGYQRRSYGWGGTTLSKVRFLGVVGAKLRTKVVAGRRPPKFNVTIVGTKRLAAEHAADWAAIHEIPAAREH